MPPAISYTMTVASPDPNPDHCSEVSLPCPNVVGIFGIENCSARIFTYCTLKTDKIKIE